ncbi:unnamed protein product [Diamesa hyperborea]
MKLIVCFVLLAVAAVSASESIFADDFDWSQAVPISETPGFWDNRDVKPIAKTNVNNRAGRIVGGNEISPNSQPHLVFMAIQVSPTHLGTCGGTVLSQRTIMTAGHCLFNMLAARLIFGAHLVRSAEPQQHIVTELRSTFRVHEQYNPRTFGNDIALVILTERLPLNQFMQPISIPTGAEIDLLFVGDNVSVYGWGFTSETSRSLSEFPKVAVNRVISNAQCAGTFGQFITPTHMCMSSEGGRGTCTGDSGGPMQTNINGRVVQIGIISFQGADSCFTGIPIAFTRVAAYGVWIRSNKVE